MRVKLQQMQFLFAFLRVNGRNQHTAGLNAHHLSGRKVGDCNQGLSDQLFRLVECVDSAENRTICACSVIKCELKKLLGLRYGNTIFNLYSSEIRLAECIEINFFLKKRLNFYVAEIDLAVRCEETCIVLSGSMSFCAGLAYRLESRETLTITSDSFGFNGF